MISNQYSLTIDLKIIKNNYQTLQKLCPQAEIGVAAKANCYGLGMDKIAPVLEEAGCQHFFVANKKEGATLRSILKYNKSSIYVLNGYFLHDKTDFTKNNLIPVLNSTAQLELWQDLAQELGKKLPCIVHINTGMNRLGMHESEIPHLKTSHLEVVCVMSHLSSSEDQTNSANEEQLAKFKELSAFFPDSKKSLANSGGIFLGPEYHFDIARPGAALYGINSAPYLTDCLIENPVNLKVPIIQVTQLKPGDYVGYNRTYKADKDMLIATLPLGYADGYLRTLSNKGLVYIKDKPAKVIGRVSMDLITIDVSNIPEDELFLGQEVEIIGPNISPDQLAQLAGTSAYEILTSLGDRYHRIYE